MSDYVEIGNVEPVPDPIYDPWPPRAEILGAALLVAAALLILSGVASALATPRITGVSHVIVLRQKVQLVARSAGVFPGLLVMGSVFLADLEHIVSAEPPARADLSRWVLRAAGAVAVVIAVSGVVGTLNVLVAPSEVFGLRSFGLRAADALFNLAGGVLGVAAAWAVASASADDVALDAQVFPGWSPNGVRPWVLVAWILLFSAVIFTVTIWLAFNT